MAADCMGPSDVVEYCMRSLLAKQGDDASEAARVLMAFAIKVTEGKAEDFVGQLQPGYFSDPATLCKYLSGQPRYETLTQMEEYKCMGTPDFSDMSRKAVQKLLVRRPGKNWEDLMINMQLVEVGATGAVNAAGSLGDGPAPKTRRCADHVHLQAGHAIGHRDSIQRAAARGQRSAGHPSAPTPPHGAMVCSSQASRFRSLPLASVPFRVTLFLPDRRMRRGVL